MTDFTGQPDQQIRDATFVVKTGSLERAGAEVVPDELIRDLLRQEWVATEVAPTPNIYVRDDNIQESIKDKSLIIVQVENYQEQFTGHRNEFVDIEVPLSIEIRTTDSRMMLWSLMAECRRIIYKWMLALQPYQVLYFDGFQPEYMGPRSYAGTMRVRLTSGAIPAFLRHVTGEEAPNTEPELFPNGV